MFLACYDTFSIAVMDDTNYSPKWKPFKESKWNDVNPRVVNPWMYQDTLHSSSLPRLGTKFIRICANVVQYIYNCR